MLNSFSVLMRLLLFEFLVIIYHSFIDIMCIFLVYQNELLLESYVVHPMVTAYPHFLVSVIIHHKCHGCLYNLI